MPEISVVDPAILNSIKVDAVTKEMIEKFVSYFFTFFLANFIKSKNLWHSNFSRVFDVS